MTAGFLTFRRVGRTSCPMRRVFNCTLVSCRCKVCKDCAWRSLNTSTLANPALEDVCGCVPPSMSLCTQQHQLVTLLVFWQWPWCKQVLVIVRHITKHIGSVTPDKKCRHDLRMWTVTDSEPILHLHKQEGFWTAYLPLKHIL